MVKPDEDADSILIKPSGASDLHTGIWAEELRAPAGAEGAEAVHIYRTNAFGRDLEGQASEAMERDPDPDGITTAWRQAIPRATGSEGA